MKKRLAGPFKVDSVLKTLVLCMLSIGSYFIYMLYRFSSQINQHTEFKISKVFILITILLFTLSFGSLIYAFAHFHEPDILTRSMGIHLISSVFDVSWIIMVCNRINLIVGARRGDKLWLNPYITSILHVIYMQYKINQSLTEPTN